MIPEAWLSEFNEKMARDGVAHISRPFRAFSEWSHQTGWSGALFGPESERVFQWFYDRSPPGSHEVLPVFNGALYYDAVFWPVAVPLGYGTNRLDGRNAMVTMPDIIWAKMCRSQRDLAVFIELWADCLDYAYGLMEILRPGGNENDWKRFLASADKELRSATHLLCQTRPSSKAIESSRMATEMALKSVVCNHCTLTAEDIRQRYNHNLGRLLEDASHTPAGEGLRPVKGLVSSFPAVGARYDGEEYPSPQLWAAYQAAQFACTAVVRSMTGRDIRQSFHIVGSQANPASS